jgi:hypothetical protein
MNRDPTTAIIVRVASKGEPKGEKRTRNNQFIAAGTELAET